MIKNKIIIFIILAASLLLGCKSQGYFVKEKMSLHLMGDTLQARYYETIIAPTNAKGTTIDDMQYRPNFFMARSVTFKSGRVMSEHLGMNDSMCYTNLYDASGKLRVSFCANIILNRIDGLVVVYSRNGTINICAEYQNSEFRNVVYYRNKSALKRFMKNSKKINYKFSRGNANAR